MEKVNSPESSALVDIIIPVFNRVDHTKQTLESLFANTPPDLFNLFVVNDCSTDPAVELYLRELLKTQVFTLVLNDKNIGPGASRNAVCEMITRDSKRSKYLYHSDNDVFFRRGWLTTLIEVYEEFYEEVLLLGGGCHPYLQDNNKLYSERVFGFKVGLKDAVSGYSQFMNWDVWDSYGPFDESMRGAEKKIMGSEDWAFCQKIIKEGFFVGSLIPELVIATGKTNTYGDPATGSETFKDQEGIIIK